MGHEPPEDRHRYGGQDCQLNQILQQEIGATEEIDRQSRYGETRKEPAGEHVDDLNRQNREAPEDEEMTLVSTRFFDYDASADLASQESVFLDEINTQIVQTVTNKLLSNW